VHTTKVIQKLPIWLLFDYLVDIKFVNWKFRLSGPAYFISNWLLCSGSNWPVGIIRF